MGRAFPSSKSKAEFLDALGLCQDQTKSHVVLRKMRDEATLGRIHLCNNRANLVPSVRDDDSAKGPFTYNELTRVAILYGISFIYANASSLTRPYYDKGSCLDGSDQSNWVIRWGLYHSFRYSDKRNKRIKTVRGVKSSGFVPIKPENRRPSHSMAGTDVELLSPTASSMSPTSEDSFDQYQCVVQPEWIPETHCMPFEVPAAPPPADVPCHALRQDMLTPVLSAQEIRASELDHAMSTSANELLNEPTTAPFSSPNSAQPKPRLPIVPPFGTSSDCLAINAHSAIQGAFTPELLLTVPGFDPSHAAKFFGIFDQVFMTLSKISEICRFMHERKAPNILAVLDKNLLQNVYEVLRDLQLGGSSNSPSPSRYKASRLYRLSLWIYLYGMVYGGISSPMHANVVDLALEYTQELLMDSSVQALLPLPLLFIGSGAFITMQRAKIHAAFQKLSICPGVDNLNVSWDLLQRIWRNLDHGQCTSWNWECLMSM